MEVAGVAIGGVSLLLELFGQSVAAYKLFVEGKELEKSSTHLMARLAIEERRLVQWGEGSGFAGESEDSSKKNLGGLGVDSRLLKNETLANVISRTLICIKDLLFDADALSTKYGLRVAKQTPEEEKKKKESEKEIESEKTESEKTESKKKESDKETESNKTELETKTDSNKTELETKTDSKAEDKQNFEKEPLRISKGTHSLRSRFRWAVKDKEGFQKLMDQLKYYNDSLYSLLPIEVGITITRDVLASLLVSASDESLLQYRTLGKKTAQGISEGKGSYDEIGSAATIALMLRYPSAKAEAVPILRNSEIQVDSESSSLATWKRRSGSDIRILLEKKIGARSQGYKKGTRHYEDLRVLATMLSQSSVAQSFHTLRCLGLTEKNANHATMVYAVPPDADPMAEPVTLYDILQGEDESPFHTTLDQRFELAKSLANAVHQMHSAGWMHKDISSHNVIFFKRMGSDYRTLYDIERPYLKGFRFARRVYAPAPQPDHFQGDGYVIVDDRAHASHGFRSPYSQRAVKSKQQHANFDLLQECLYQHPSYLFHRLISEAEPEKYRPSEIDAYMSNNNRKSYYKYRHEYFSLGVVLLEIGLWRSLDSMDILREVVAPTSIWNLPTSLRLTYSYGTWDVRPLRGRMDTIMRIVRSSRMQYLNDESATSSSSDEWPEELEDYITSLQKVLREEQIVGIRLETTNAAKSGSNETFWSLWDEVYPHASLRKDAVGLAKSMLGLPMGKKFRNAVVRCLASDFSIDAEAVESTWLRAFNWVVVKELENCNA